VPSRARVNVCEVSALASRSCLVSERLGHSFVAVTGDVHGQVVDQGARSPSGGSQRQWAAENVCRGYTDGYTAAKRPPRILSETASDAVFRRDDRI
jgi:hypothetical protein